MPGRLVGLVRFQGEDVDMVLTMLRVALIYLEDIKAKAFAS